MLRSIFYISRSEKFDEHALNVGKAQKADMMLFVANPCC